MAEPALPRDGLAIAGIGSGKLKVHGENYEKGNNYCGLSYRNNWM